MEMVKVSAKRDFNKALVLVNEYLSQIQKEERNAEEAIRITKQILDGKEISKIPLCLKRKEVSEYLDISMDTLRNWELNGLMRIKRKQNGYRYYTDEDIKRLKIIRSLRCANYSLEAILRMLRALSDDPNTNIKQALNTPRDDTDIISVCDRLIISLQKATENAKKMIDILHDMKSKFS